MFAHHNITDRRRWMTFAAAVLFAVCVTRQVQAQVACPPDASGDFKPTSSRTCQMPDDGVFNFRDVVIPQGVVIGFCCNSKNTPVTIIASREVILSGYIIVDGVGGNGRFGGDGGRGGFKGGKGGSFLDVISGTAGDGPGGGAGGPGAANDINGGGGGSFARSGGSGREGGPTPGTAGPRYGTSSLIPLIGGSGGGGGSAGPQGTGGGGGGGGGAILISARKITFTNTGDSNYGIYARGGVGHGGTGSGAAGSGGSGGAIRLVAVESISGNPIFNVDGGEPGGFRGNFGGQGYIRVESPNLAQFQPRGSATISVGLQNPTTVANLPQLTIKSVGGINAPANPIGSLHQLPDITVPTSVANPVTVVIEARNIPVAPATQVQVTLTRESGERLTVSSSNLTGTTATSTANASVTLPTTGINVITAALTLDALVAFNRPMFLEGERVKQVEIAAAFGGASEVTYITESGRRIKQSE